MKSSNKVSIKNIHIAKPQINDSDHFIKSTVASGQLHTPWVEPPKTTTDYQAYLKKIEQDNNEGFLIKHNDTHTLVGVININEIVRGSFQSAYLGYYAFSGHEGKGLMSQGLQLVISHAFDELGLHRLEANIQPDNINSINFIKHNGFRREGYSHRYLKINGEWQDHERWAITSED